jgi:CYTH domain-containing protein
MSKTKLDVMTNDEKTSSILVDHAEHLLLNYCEKIIDKTRYVKLFDGKKWEIDLFRTPTPGLILAEIELISKNEQITLPPWVIREVTGEPQYYNANM